MHIVKDGTIDRSRKEEENVERFKEEGETKMNEMVEMGERCENRGRRRERKKEKREKEIGMRKR